jgi:RNA polymerase sigma-70 factor (ECF subfamily)
MDEHRATEVVTSFYGSFYPSLVRYAAHITGSLDLAQDIVQEAFMRLYRALREGQSIANPKAWAFTVVRHESCARLRQRNDERLAHQGLDALEDLPVGRWAGVVPGFEGDDVARLVSLLSKREQEALLLRMEGLKYREIGGELGISIQSVSTLLSRALRKLQAVLGPKTKEALPSTHVEESVRRTLQ